MPTLYDIKPAFQARLRPLTARLAAAGVTANQVTIAACVLSIAAGGAIALWPQHRAVFWLLPLVLFVRMALNAIDGMLAREHGQASKLGMYLNELTDVVSDLALILPFAVIGLFPAWGVVAFAIVAVLTEFAGVLGIAAKVGAGSNPPPPLTLPGRATGLARPSDPRKGEGDSEVKQTSNGRCYDGPVGKSDRALALGIIAALLALSVPLQAVAPYVFPVLALASLATVYNRVRNALA